MFASARTHKKFCQRTWTMSTKNFIDMERDDVRNNFTNMDTNKNKGVSASMDTLRLYTKLAISNCST